jgi:eukaryotic-like serine/threonine-protein kinase
VTTVPGQAAAGIVVAESPAAGAKVAKNSTVSLKASKGPATVPDVRGQLAADAKGALRTAGLVPVEFQVPGTQPKGTVTAQKALPNKKVPRGSKVRINVSTGSTGGGGGGAGTTTTSTPAPAPQKVTERGRDPAERRAGPAPRWRVARAGQVRALESAGGRRCRAEPWGRHEREQGLDSPLAVSRGPNPTLTVVPDVAGKTPQAATTTLQNAGFKVQVLTAKPANPSQSGRVVDEQPAGTTRAPDGSTVTIYVGSS